MSDTVFLCDHSDFGVAIGCTSAKDYKNGEAAGKPNQNQPHQHEASHGSHAAFGSLYDQFNGSGIHEGERSIGELRPFGNQLQQSELVADNGVFQDLGSGVAFPTLQSCSDMTAKMGDVSRRRRCVEETEMEDENPFRMASMQLLKSYQVGFKNLRETEAGQNNHPSCPDANANDLSAEMIFRMAAEIFIQSSSEGVDDLLNGGYPIGFHFAGISDNQIKDVELAVSLFSAAESVALQQILRADRLLANCDLLSSHDGSTVQRIVYYFSEALGERIHPRRGGFLLKGLEKMHNLNTVDATVIPNPFGLACHRQLPFTQVLHFTGIQSVVESVGGATRVHLIDFGLRFGVHWTILMQALADRESSPLEILKVTAIGTTSKSKLEDTGKRLSIFAESLNIPFVFRVAIVADFLDLKENLIDLQSGEVIAVYVPYILTRMVSMPDHLDHMMTFIRNINPRIMVMIEIEANHNSTSFGNRFAEALFYYSALFDCLETYQECSEPDRITAESVYCSQAIRNIVAAEGEARTTRHVKISVWRAFFARFGLSESQLSASSLYQATLVLKEYRCGSKCDLIMDGKSLTIGWKGTPLFSLSAWTFA